MSETPTTRPRPRAPLVFDADDPAVSTEPKRAGEGAAPHRPAEASVRAAEVAGAPVSVGEGADGDLQRPQQTAGFRLGWGAVLLAALTALMGLVASLAFARLVSDVLARSDWIGMAGWGLLGVVVLAGFIIVMREVVGLVRLGRLADLRREAEEARRARDVAVERGVVRRLRRVLAGRSDLDWALSRFAEHERDVRDPGDLLALAEREILAPLDTEARRLVLGSAKRVSLVTAMSPVAVIAVGFVMVENLRMLRRLAELYGGRPGFLGGLKLGRMVIVHILATGGIALTDDLIGQLVGQDLARRLSRRLGEGLFNGALTARIGAAAVEVCRPLPFIEATPVRVRDILAELTRRARSTARAGRGSA